MSRPSASAKQRTEEIDGLKSAFTEVTDELKQLNSKVRELAEMVEALAARQPATGDAPAVSVPRRQPSTPTAYREVLITVRPLPELAMAAMAESSLRGMSAVKRVVSVERVEDRARFRLEVATDTDLISDMRTALPVSFRVTESKPDEVSLELKWLWGMDS